MDNDDIVLPEYVKPGATLRLFWEKGNRNNKVIHIRAIVDDEWVVYRYWIKQGNRGRWTYKIEWKYWFHLLEEKRRVTVVKSGEGA